MCLQACVSSFRGSLRVQRCHLTYDGSTDPRLLALIERVPAELWGAKLALAVVQHRLLGAASPYAP